MFTSQDKVSAAYSNKELLTANCHNREKIVLCIYEIDQNKKYTCIANQTPSSVKQNMKVEQSLDNLFVADLATELEIPFRESSCW